MNIEPLNFNKMFEKKKVKQRHDIQIYQKILTKCLSVIKHSMKYNKGMCSYNIPPFIWGLPTYDIRKCGAFIYKYLKKQHLKVSIEPVDETLSLFISWEHLMDRYDEREDEYIPQPMPLAPAPIAPPQDYNYNYEPRQIAHQQNQIYQQQMNNFKEQQFYASSPFNQQPPPLPPQQPQQLHYGAQNQYSQSQQQYIDYPTESQIEQQVERDMIEGASIDNDDLVSSMLDERPMVQQAKNMFSNKEEITKNKIIPLYDQEVAERGYDKPGVYNPPLLQRKQPIFREPQIQRKRAPDEVSTTSSIGRHATTLTNFINKYKF